MRLGSFDPARHPDEYRSAVLAAVDEKVEAGQIARDGTTEGEAPAAMSQGAGAQVIDLAELLSRSLRRRASPVRRRPKKPLKKKSRRRQREPREESAPPADRPR